MLLTSHRQRGAIPLGVCEFGKTRCGVSTAGLSSPFTGTSRAEAEHELAQPRPVFVPLSACRFPDVYWLSFAYQCKKGSEMTSAVVEQIKTNNLSGNEVSEVVKSLMDKERARSKADAPQIAGLLVAILRVAQFEDPMILDQAEAVRVRLNELSSWWELK
jgi:hypothetical protein